MRIPSYQRKEQIQPLQGGYNRAYAPASAFGVQNWQQAEQTGSLVAGIAFKQQQENEERNVIDAVNIDDLWVKKSLYTDDPDNPGLMQQEGYNTVDSAQKFEAGYWENYEQNIKPLLKTQRERDAFRKMTETRYKNTVSSLLQNTYNNVKKADDASVTAMLDNDANESLNEIIQNKRIDPASLETSFLKTAFAVKKLIPGIGEEDFKNKVREVYTAKYFTPALNAINDPAQTEQLINYAKQNPDKINQSSILQAEAQLIKQKEQQQQYVQREAIFNDTSLKDANGLIDIDRLRERLISQYRIPKYTKSGSGNYAPELPRVNMEDWEGVDEGHKIAVNNFGQILSSLGVNATITSGRRSEANNTAVGGSPTSWHLQGKAIDLDVGNLSTELQQQIEDLAVQAGWGEVLYHDAGTGVHLHLANFQGDLELGTIIEYEPDYKKIDWQISQAEAYNVDVRRNNATIKKQAGDMFKQAQQTASMSEIMQIAESNPLLAAFYSTVPPKVSNPQVLADLKALEIDNALDEQTLIEAMPYLKLTDRNNYYEKLAIQDMEIERDALKEVDSQIKAEINARFPNYFGTATNKEVEGVHAQLLYAVNQEIDHIKDPTERLVAGRKVMDSLSKDMSKAEVQTAVVSAIEKSKENDIVWNEIEKAWGQGTTGKKFLRLVRQGFPASDSNQINEWLSWVGNSIDNGDSVAQLTIDYMILKGTPINESSFREVYNRIRFEYGGQ